MEEEYIVLAEGFLNETEEDKRVDAMKELRANSEKQLEAFGLNYPREEGWTNYWENTCYTGKKEKARYKPGHVQIWNFKFGRGNSFDLDNERTVGAGKSRSPIQLTLKGFGET